MKPMTVDDLWALPRVGAPVPSPDGTRALVPVTAYSMERNEGVTQLWLVDLRARKRRMLTTAEASSGQPAWSPDGRRIAFVRKPGGKAAKHADRPQIHVLTLEGGEPERVTDLPLGAIDPKWFPDGRLAILVPLRRDALTIDATAKAVKASDEDPVKACSTEDRYFRYWDRWIHEGPIHHVFELDLDSRRLVDWMPSSTWFWDPDEPAGHYDIAPDGLEIAFSVKSSERWMLTAYRMRRGRKPESLLPGHGADTARPRYSPDGRLILFGLKRDPNFYADRVRLATFDRRTRRVSVLTESWDVSARGWSWRGKEIVFAAEVDARSAFFSMAAKPATPKELCRGGHLTDPQPAGNVLVANQSTLTRPPEIVAVSGGRIDRVTDFVDVRHLKLGTVEEEYFPGAGGDRVQMFVVKPPGWKRGRRYPLVHMIHGGPHGVFGDEWHWRWNAQAFAAPGYVVALVNFHGSTSWGQEFAKCIQGRWGDQPYVDIMAATDRLIERGLVDAKRMAVTGGSYGGYLTAWICAKTARFACAINHAGVSDLQAQWGCDVTQGDEIALGGAPWSNREGMDRFSPMRRAEGFKTPMLVLHGEKDYRVPYGEGVLIYNVYKARGLPARLVVFPDENHWILKPRNSRHWYGEVHEWLRRWL